MGGAGRQLVARYVWLHRACPSQFPPFLVVSWRGTGGTLVGLFQVAIGCDGTPLGAYFTCMQVIFLQLIACSF